MNILKLRTFLIKSFHEENKVGKPEKIFATHVTSKAWVLKKCKKYLEINSKCMHQRKNGQK